MVAKIEALQERSRRAREALSEVSLLLEQFRQSVLAAAFRGDLTADWRAAHPNVEPASELLHRIRVERRRCWEEAELAKYEAKGQKPPKNWQATFDEWEKKAVRSSAAKVNTMSQNLSRLPTGWEWARLGDFVRLQAGYAFKSRWFARTGIRLLRGINIEPGRTRWEEVVYLPEARIAEFSDYLLEEGDVVIAMDRPVISTGLKIACLSHKDIPALLLQRVGRFFIDGGVSAEFLYFYLQGPIFLQHIGVQATGTQLPHISANDIESAFCPLPPLAEQVDLVSTISELLDTETEIRRAVSKSSDDLNSLDQAILAKAFRGELVPQDPGDEPAAALLERIQEQMAQQVEATKGNRKASRTQRRNQMGKKLSELTSQRRPLTEVLTTKGQPMTPEQLLAESGYDDDSIEEFYLALRKEVEKGRIRENRPTESDVILEAIKP
jgi:type I restriction enzyme S subunit